MESFSTHILGYIYPYIGYYVSPSESLEILSLSFRVIQDVVLIEVYAELQQMSRLHLQLLELNPVLLQNYKRSTDPLAEGCIKQRYERRGFSEVLDLLNDRSFVILELYLFHFDMYFLVSNSLVDVV